MKRTPEKQAAFCTALAAVGTVSRACREVGIGRVTAYAWRDEDEAFAAEWDKAKAMGFDALEDEAIRRAFEGSDTLLIFLLKAAKPEKYRERKDVRLSGDTSLAEAIVAARTRSAPA